MSGTEGSEGSGRHQELVERLGGVEVKDTEGRPVALRGLWQSQTAALVFVRHFG